ncbi:MAG: hypothetical protein J6D53_08370 [Blautia sp.]|nr:hypothetical protein [Blautia sp.]
MKKYIRFFAVPAAAVLVCSLAGCSGTEIKDELVSRIEGETQEEQPAVTATPTPAPTATPIPPTATPVPTSTPAPRRIGTKTPQSKYVYLTNGLPEALREVYLRGSGDGDWGKNMIPVESTVKASEKVQMCYTPSDTGGGFYDLKVVDKKGNSYAIYEINIGDFEEGTVRVEGDSAYLSYISLSTGDETRAEYSETLAQNYDTDGSSDNHEGDYNYGYYDDYGNWVTYDYTNSSSGSTSSSSTVGDYNYGYYDDYGNWVEYDYSGSSSGGMGTGTVISDSHEGDYNYGYYDDYGNWVSYY